MLFSTFFIPASYIPTFLSSVYFLIPAILIFLKIVLIGATNFEKISRVIFITQYIIQIQTKQYKKNMIGNKKALLYNYTAKQLKVGTGR